MSARIHALQQDAFWKYIINGKAKPLGEVLDFWRRVEFQLKGTPHSHNLINVMRDHIDEDTVLSSDPAVLTLVLDEVRRVGNARLQPRSNDDQLELPADQVAHEFIREQEKDYAFNLIDRKGYFKDSQHPCRSRFESAGRNYYIDHRNAEISDLKVQSDYRRLQLANQMHQCRQSCFKYCSFGEPKICRYNFIKPILQGNDSQSVCEIDEDKLGRKRVRVYPPRNNGNLNTCCTSPLMFMACRGNQDIQYIDNKSGGAEYASKYASKADTPESRSLQNAISRKLANLIVSMPPHQQLSIGQKIRTVGNAVIASQQIGTVHACYVLGQQHLVKSSRIIVTANSLKRQSVTTLPIILDNAALGEMDDADSAINNSPGTQLGKRDAYHMLYVQQMTTFSSVNFDFFAFLSSYRTGKEIIARKPSSKIKEGVHHLTVDKYGFINNAKSFFLNKTLYTAVRKLQVVSLVPHIPVSEDSERSAYSILLMHSDWGVIGGEADLLRQHQSAVDRLNEIKHELPQHVQVSLSKRKQSEILLANTGNPDAQQTVVNMEDFDKYMNDQQQGEEEEDAEFEEANRRNNNDIVDEQGVSLVDISSTNSGERRVFVNTPRSQCAFLINFVENLRKSREESHVKKFSLSSEEMSAKINDPTLIVDIDNVAKEREHLQDMVNQLNEKQRQGFNSARQHVSGENSEQMIMFLSGEGGTGKSHLIHTITKYAQCTHGKSEGVYGVVLKTAPTGGAAFNIGGHTWHSALGKANTKRVSAKTQVPPQLRTALQKKLKGTVLFILDEISLASLEDLYEISYRMCLVTGEMEKPFGGINTILAGDLFQMKTMSGKCIVETNISSSNIEATIARNIFAGKLTHYCLLTENVRAANSNGELSNLARFCTTTRLGLVPPGILEMMNTRVVNSIQQAVEKAHPKAIWITSTHDRIAMINKVFSKKMVEDGGKIIRIVAGHVPAKVGIPIPDQQTRYGLYGVAGCKKGSRTAPMLTHLDLQIGTRVRIIRNILVECGLFNGSMGTVWGFVYKGAGPQTSEERVPTNFAILTDEQREIPIVLVQMDGTDHEDPSKSSFPYTCCPSVPRLIPVVGILGRGRVQQKYYRIQLPLLVSHARTAHSVQGYTAENGIVVDVGSKFFAGDYVAISRAKSIEQISLLSPVQERHFTLDPEYRLKVEEEYTRLARSFNNSSGGNNV